MRPMLLTLMMTALLAWPAAAKDKPTGDDEHGDDDGHGEDGDDGHGDGHDDHGGGHHHRLLFGAKGAAAWAASGHGNTALYGGGVFGEVSVVHGWLEIELGAKLLTAKGGGLHVPIDLLIKKPFATDKATFFLGIGPALTVVSHHHETHAYFGIAGVAGVYLWLAPSFGILLEANDSVVFEDEVVNELGGAVGVVFGI